jgi:HD-GYP domain-containing protein (c-di-GMP phosphodiesterase class II)
MTMSRALLSEEILRRFTAAVRAGQLYAPNHPIVARNVTLLAAVIEQLHQVEASIVIGIVQDEIIVGDIPIATGEGHASFVRRLKRLGVERIVIERGASLEELGTFMSAINVAEPHAADGSGFPSLAHIRVGRVSVAPGVSGRAEAISLAAFRRVYDDAVSAADVVWNSALSERHVDATVANDMVAGLADAVAQSRTPLLALTTLKHFNNYTFTHMVNVSILTMGQARGLGVEGPLLREFGLAGLMHDIGKVRTPPEILNKTSNLTEAEFTIVKRHPVDGAEILRGTPDVPPLAPVVAFEHHRRQDGSGYPDIERDGLNLATTLCSIADVYDAMRSQRQYQQAFASERILTVLTQRDGRQFDRHLVRRFVQLIGIYPAGSVVRLDSGQIAVVINVHAPDAHRPQVRILIDRDGTAVERPFEVNLWEGRTEQHEPTTIIAPIDAAALAIDPLALL